MRVIRWASKLEEEAKLGKYHAKNECFQIFQVLYEI